jgi:ketosteroid isomerase-like protein
MSQENVERMRQGLDAFNRRDRAGWLALCDPDYETVPSDDWPEMEPIRGPEAAWDFYVEADEPWEGSPYEYVELIDAGNDKVVAHQRREMRGKASGASVVYSYWVVVTFRDGKVLRIEWFAERAKALEAVGLSESFLQPGDP